MNARFQADITGFSDMINKRAIVFGIDRQEAFKTEARLLAQELIERTPPFSGKSLVKMLGAQGKSLSGKNLEVTELSAQKVGQRRVEMDVRHVIHGLKGAARELERKNKRAGGSRDKTFFVSQTNPRANSNFRAEDRARAKVRQSEITKEKIKFGSKTERDGGYLQKCQGRDAVRIYADKTGNVYGVDTEQFNPRASLADVSKFHNFARTKNGRVTRAGKGDLVTGRWRWLNRLVVKAATLNKYLRAKKEMVGQAKGGWGAAFMRLGGRMSAGGWIGKHAAKAGRVRTNFTTDQIAIEMINRSRWASGGDTQRIIPAAIAGRAESLKGAIRRHMQDAWRTGKPVTA